MHAHLAGSVRRKTLQDLLEQKGLNLDYSCFEAKDMHETFQIFDLIYKGLTTLQDIKRVTKEMLEDFQQENTIYLEIRSTPKQTEFYNQDEYLTTIFEEIHNFDQQFSQNMIVRFILSIDRSKDVQEAWNRLNLYKKFKKNEKYSKYLVGLDWCGNPHKNHFSQFLPVFQQTKQENIPITIHTGEVQGVIDETQMILDFKPDRLGHFNLYNKEQFEQVLKEKIPIEMCPTSNKYTLYLDSYKDHHFSDFYKQKHTMSFNTDDNCCFNTNITNEYEQMVNAFDLQKNDLYTILMNSVDMIFDKQHQQVLREKIDLYFKTDN
ncbi:hypothetical protein PPERSA_12618 [Pseudocohnilembus persalinus]|uniref:Adenosine deaminase domain-containing protein n=1 Tax=Pseudocohnilembus persalinus TaxID=266149 RepID=A0A0V0QCG8_PSEPJ|nr:hypothetical protein PPERSA_12618 [Pseudocohnilembus persalinus]|eukprot:KRW99942.1 hypothetical protein PPERSA_12618 [Pseudocohnilembus persalinus]